MENFLELYWTDVYKTGHKSMLPPNSILMYSNFTPRSGKLSNCPNNGFIVSIGQQMLVRKIKEDWDNNFFKRPVEEIEQFGRDMTEMLMLKEEYNVDHFKKLHKLGYLPLRIKAIKEGALIPYKIPLTTIVNTKPLEKGIFDWLVNYLETITSSESWQAPTSATVAYTLRQLGRKWITITDPETLWFLDYQFHDFSMRGMGGKSAIINSGIGFASSSKGSDTLPVIPAARKYYDEVNTCISSVLASEHAIMCTLTGFFLQQKDGTWDKIGELEVETFRYLLKLFPTGILSLVSDTWDLWRVVTEYCTILKDEILARDGKLVIRPDSGDPVDIVCGLENKPETHLFMRDTELRIRDNNTGISDEISIYEKKGVVELLWEVFGGDITSMGYKRLNPKIGVIYGDSITYNRAEDIFERLEMKGFASTNIVLGVGSYTLQYVTRDTHGFAQKATYVEILNDDKVVGIEIFKDPITDSGKVKKSARGLMQVFNNRPDAQGGDLLFDGKDQITLRDQVSWEEEAGGLLQTIFEDGEFYNKTTLTEIRERLISQSEINYTTELSK